MSGVLAGIIAGIHAFFALFTGSPAAPTPQMQPFQDGQSPSQIVQQVVNPLPVDPTLDPHREGPNSPQQAAGDSGMSKYTDTDFGFSFWYPTGWTVTKHHSGSSSDSEMEILICSNPCNDQAKEFALLEHNSRDGANYSFGKAYGRIYFDASKHTWMDENHWDPQQGLGNYPAIPADVSVNTMGGLHIIADSIVPLSASHFVIMQTNGPGDSAYSLLKTLVATDRSVASPLSDAEQAKTIQAEAKAFGVPQQPVALKTYTDNVNGFSFQYPATISPDTSDFRFGGFASPSAENLVSLKTGPVSLYISLSPDPKDVGNCKVAPEMYEDSVGKISTVKIGDISFATYSVGDAAMGHYTNEQMYHTLHNNACYEIRVVTESSRTETDAEAQAQKSDIASATALIDPVVQSFRFITDTSSVTPPTCTLKNDKFTYNLGDVIKLSWSSKDATRALWDQAVENNTGVRKVMMPPEGEPGVSGTANTVANLEGYQSIKLQVVGPGGFGTCSTQVSVNASDAHSSITVDSVDVQQSPSDINPSDMTITISGTATNGALYNDAINLVLEDPSYAGPFDQASVYADVNRKYFYAGGSQADMRKISLPFEHWTSDRNYIPIGTTRVRVLAYPHYYVTTNWSQNMPIVNKIISVTR